MKLKIFQPLLLSLIIFSCQNINYLKSFKAEKNNLNDTQFTKEYFMNNKYKFKTLNMSEIYDCYANRGTPRYDLAVSGVQEMDHMVHVQTVRLEDTMVLIIYVILQ